MNNEWREYAWLRCQKALMEDEMYLELERNDESDVRDKSNVLCYIKGYRDAVKLYDKNFNINFSTEEIKFICQYAIHSDTKYLSRISKGEDCDSVCENICYKKGWKDGTYHSIIMK